MKHVQHGDREKTELSARSKIKPQNNQTTCPRYFLFKVFTLSMLRICFILDSPPVLAGGGGGGNGSAESRYVPKRCSLSWTSSILPTDKTKIISQNDKRCAKERLTILLYGPNKTRYIYFFMKTKYPLGGRVRTKLMSMCTSEEHVVVKSRLMKLDTQADRKERNYLVLPTDKKYNLISKC